MLVSKDSMLLASDTWAESRRNVKSRHMATRPGRRRYHHGNLREALIAAARRLIAERGPAGFTLVEAARLARVSPAAPYRHFVDRDALLAEVAQRGFDEFDRRLAAAWQAAKQDPGAAFLRMGQAYLGFARDEPGYYSAMFAAGAPVTGKRLAHRKASFVALERAIAQVAASSRKNVDPRPLAYQVWALSHGLATLAAARQLPTGDARLKPGALLQDGVRALVSGAGPAGPGRRAGPGSPRRRPPAASRHRGGSPRRSK
jgi:AcrR family transcriptional regulator